MGKIVEFIKDSWKVILPIIIFVIIPTIIGRFILDEYAMLLSCWAAGMIPISGLIYLLVFLVLFIQIAIWVYKKVKKR